LREHNIKVALDDFGVGFSSLSYLHDLELDLIKIDRSFIKDYPVNDDGVILKAMVRMAKELKIPTLIEGIETKEQLNFVKSLQVDFYQGFYFSKALKEDDFKKLFKRHND
ncbi:MAG: EAL domain-containing protein, partial [Bacteroidia bacterium]|nr:EAL domain-containing protein [Bacteroidia bacterium]